MRGFTLLEEGIGDLGFAVRRIRHRPGLGIAVITMLALGVGATTAAFSALDAALLRPLPFTQPSQLVTLPEVDIPFDPGTQREREEHHSLDITDVSGMKDVFSSTAAYAAGGLNLNDPVNPQRVRVGVVTTAFFATLGARTQRGRTFDDSEGTPGGFHVTILSDAFWTRRFGRIDMIGKSIRLN